MPESMIRVDRDRIIYGSILSFKIDDVETGATTGEVTVRRAVEYFDITVEQVDGTIAKSLINDQRFLELTLAEANLPNIRRAWDDAGGVVVSQTYTDFDASEAAPWGLAATTSGIFMVGQSNDGLYNLDNLGKATRVRASNAVVDPASFGLTVAEAMPTGLAFVGDDLYMVGQGTQKLYKLNSDDGTGAIVQDGNTATDDFGTTAAEVLPTGLASDGTILYMVGETGKELYTLDLTTGVASPLGTPVTNFGTVMEEKPRGLAHDGTNLYMLGATNASLYQLNVASGVATRIGAASNFGVGETEPTGLTWFNNSLWMTGTTTQKLYKLSNVTGMAEAVGDKEVLHLNNPSDSELEHKIELISPGADGRYRRYTFYRAVSISEGEHMIQKDGLTMVPLSFEILNDPLKTDGAQFGTIEDIPTLAS